MPTGPDGDADSTPETGKRALRERVWDDLEDAGVARFPFPPHGRIPNVAGAADAADRLADLPVWRGAETIKANPDAPQLPVRRQALRDGKRLFVAVPRLREEQCFLELDPEEIADYDAATTVSGISEYGTPRKPADLPDVDLIVTGSVAASTDGARIGKGEGYSDLEWAILAEHGRVDETTTVVTTIHERQLVEAVDAADHDVRLDVLVTAERTIETGARGQPAGIDWDRLSTDRLDEIPVLRTLAADGDRRSD